MNVLDEIKLKTRFSKEKYHFNRFYGLADFACVFWKVNLIKKVMASLLVERN